MLFLWQTNGDCLAERPSALDAIVLGTPLVVFVGGPGSGRVFDLLLRALATSSSTSGQIMTRHSEGSLEECLEELLQGTWPSEGRFDDWTRYLVVSEDSALDAARRTSKRILGATK